jgi:tRNA(Met) C34 N-acetyltransferase TmcA
MSSSNPRRGRGKLTSAGLLLVLLVSTARTGHRADDAPDRNAMLDVAVTAAGLPAVLRLFTEVLLTTMASHPHGQNGR